jgi:hypothetical protein
MRFSLLSVHDRSDVERRRTPRDADAYAEYIANTGMAAYRSTSGNQGAWMLRRDDGDRSEIVAFSLWDSVDSIRAFAGNDIDQAVFYPEDVASSSNVIGPCNTTKSWLDLSARHRQIRDLHRLGISDPWTSSAALTFGSLSSHCFC